MQFLQLLRGWIKSNHNFGYKRVTLSIDNWSSHRAEKIQRFLKLTNWNIFYLPPYSPQMAPVELAFHRIKKKMTLLSKSNNISLNGASGYRHIMNSLKVLDYKSVKDWFEKFYQILKEHLPIFILRENS